MVEDHPQAASLADRNAVLAHEVIAGDSAIDALEREITRRVRRAIARQQPVARDLRNIASNMKLVTDLERIADHAEDVSRHALSIMDSGIGVEMPSDLRLSQARSSTTCCEGALDAPRVPRPGDGVPRHPHPRSGRARGRGAL